MKTEAAKEIMDVRLSSVAIVNNVVNKREKGTQNINLEMKWLSLFMSEQVFDLNTLEAMRKTFYIASKVFYLNTLEAMRKTNYVAVNHF